MLVMSGLMPILEHNSFEINGERLCIYGDPAYPLRWYQQGPFKGGQITREQEAFNTTMSNVRITVKWLFGDIIETFKFTDFKKTQNIQCFTYKCSHLFI